MVMRTSKSLPAGFCDLRSDALQRDGERMLELESAPVPFEPDKNNNDGNVTLNFFDESSLRICTMRNNGALGLTAKSLNSAVKETKVRTKDRGVPSTIKFSPNGKFCIIQRATQEAHLIFLEKLENSLCVEMTIPTKTREPIIDVEWISNSQILLVTNNNAELVFFNEEKQTYKLLRSTNINAAWASYYAPCNVLIIANGLYCSNLQPIVVAHSQFTRMKSFEVDFGASNSKEKLHLKDINVATLYGKLYVMVLRHSVRNSSTTDLALHELATDQNSVSAFKYSLILGFTGGCSVHVFENLVIVHHMPTKKSLIFDIGVAAHRPNHSPLVTVSITPNPQLQLVPSLYSPFWFTFLPNIIIDSSVGMMYAVRLKNEDAMLEIADKSLLLEYLARRAGEKSLFLRSLLDCLLARALSLRQVRKTFQLLATNLATSSSAELPQTPSKVTLVVKPAELLIVTQQEMQSSIFIPLRDDPTLNGSYVGSVMLQYLRALCESSVPVEAYFIESVVETLAAAGEMRKLHQLVTYRVINDSKPLAFLLISYEARCPTLFQSGVDILARSKASDEIVEVMIEKKNVVDAIRYIDARGLSDGMIPKVVEAAKKSYSRQTRYAIKEHLTERKTKLQFGEHFEQLFTDEEVEIATNEVATCFPFEL